MCFVSTAISKFNKKRSSFTEEDKMPSNAIQCITNTSNQLREQKVCNHPPEFNNECIYCDFKLNDDSTNNPKLYEARNKFLQWITDYLKFNNIEFPCLIKEVERMIILSVNFPEFFNTPTNPNVHEFLKNVESIDITNDSEGQDSVMRELIS